MRKDKQQCNDPWDRDFYETGSTQPPKQHGGLIAFLLALVILLGGACSALGILNFRLLQELAHGDRSHETLTLFENTVVASPKETITADDSRLPRLGVTGQTVSEFDRHYYELPRGVLVTDVAEDRCAHRAGIRPGDVIFSLEGKAVATQEELAAALNSLKADRQIKVEVFRSQTRERFIATVTILQEDED